MYESWRNRRKEGVSSCFLNLKLCFISLFQWNNFLVSFFPFLIWISQSSMNQSLGLKAKLERVHGGTTFVFWAPWVVPWNLEKMDDEHAMLVCYSDASDLLLCLLRHRRPPPSIRRFTSVQHAAALVSWSQTGAGSPWSNHHDDLSRASRSAPLLSPSSSSLVISHSRRNSPQFTATAPPQRNCSHTLLRLVVGHTLSQLAARRIA